MMRGLTREIIDYLEFTTIIMLSNLYNQTKSSIYIDTFNFIQLIF